MTVPAPLVPLTEPSLARTESLITWQKSPSCKVKVAVSDIDGILRGKFLHIDKFRSVAESNFGFCNVIFGWIV
jgi:glutamine synthetase